MASAPAYAAPMLPCSEPVSRRPSGGGGVAPPGGAELGSVGISGAGPLGHLLPSVVAAHRRPSLSRLRSSGSSPCTLESEELQHTSFDEFVSARLSDLHHALVREHEFFMERGGGGGGGGVLHRDSDNTPRSDKNLDHLRAALASAGVDTFPEPPPSTNHLHVPVAVPHVPQHKNGQDGGVVKTLSQSNSMNSFHSFHSTRHDHPGYASEVPLDSRLASVSPSARHSMHSMDSTVPMAGMLNSPVVEFAQRLSGKLEGVDTSLDGGSGECDDRVTKAFEVLPLWKARSPSGLTVKAITRSSQESQPSHGAGESEAELIEAHAPEASACMIHPGSFLQMLWVSLAVLLVIYECVMTPLQLFKLEDRGLLSLMQWAIRIYWALNLPISSRTGFLLPRGTAEMDPRRVAYRYAATWLVPDLALVVSDWSLAGQWGTSAGDGADRGSSTAAMRLRGALQSLFLVRALRVVQMIQKPEFAALRAQRIRSEQVILLAHIAMLMLLTLWLAHCAACLWYGVGTLGGETGWVEILGYEKESTSHTYCLSFYWALAQLAGEATGVMEPQTGEERVFAMCVLFFFFISTAALVSSITTAMTRLHFISSEQATQLTALRRYLIDARISRPLAMRVQSAAQQAMQEQRRNPPESSIEALRLISSPLRAEMHYEVHFRIIGMHPFFDEYHIVNPIGMQKVCHYAISSVPLSCGDKLFSDNERPATPRMMFVVTGQMIYSVRGSPAQRVEVNQWLCEATLWTDWVHCGTLTATSLSRLLAINSKTFQAILSGFNCPHARLYASEFVQVLNAKLERGQRVTDTGLTEDDMTKILDVVFPVEDESLVEEAHPSTPHGDSSLDLDSPGLAPPGLGTPAVRSTSGSRSSQDDDVAAFETDDVAPLPQAFHKPKSREHQRGSLLGFYRHTLGGGALPTWHTSVVPVGFGLAGNTPVPSRRGSRRESSQAFRSSHMRFY